MVICNLHVQKKIKPIQANFSVRHSKLPPSMYFRLLRASYFMLLARYENDYQFSATDKDSNASTNKLVDINENCVRKGVEYGNSVPISG